MSKERRLALEVMLASMDRNDCVTLLGMIYDRTEYLERLEEWGRIGAN